MALSCFHPCLWINRCDRVGTLPKVPPPSCGEGSLFFRYNQKDLCSVLGKRLMQLPGCVWRLWLMSGSLCDELVLLSPVVSSVGSPTALQTAKAEEEEEGCVCIVLSSNYLVILTSVFVAEANFANSFHLTLQSPVIWSFDKTGLQTSVTADCLRLLTLSTWTQTKPVLNCSVKNKSYLLIYFSLFFGCIAFFFFLSHCSVPPL